MTAALDVSAHGTDCLTFASNSHQSVIAGSSINLVDLHTGSCLECWAIVVCGSIIVGRNVRNIFQIVHPDTQRTSTARLARKVVSGILDDKAYTGVTSEVDRDLELRSRGDIDRVYGIATPVCMRQSRTNSWADKSSPDIPVRTSR